MVHSLSGVFSTMHCSFVTKHVDAVHNQKVWFWSCLTTTHSAYWWNVVIAFCVFVVSFSVLMDSLTEFNSMFQTREILLWSKLCLMLFLTAYEMLISIAWYVQLNINLSAFCSLFFPMLTDDKGILHVCNLILIPQGNKIWLKELIGTEGEK